MKLKKFLVATIVALLIGGTTVLAGLPGTPEKDPPLRCNPIVQEF